MGCKIIAHRGSNKEAPQNTLPAFRRAIAEGTDGFETDVHVTKDGALVICHNYTIDATSDGRGEITSYTLGELKLFDFGSYFSDEFKGTPLPTVDEFLELVGPTDAEIINIELKSPRQSESGIVKKTLARFDYIYNANRRFHNVSPQAEHITFSLVKTHHLP